MVDRTIEWGDPPAYFTGDGGSNAPDGNFVVAETSGGVKLLEYDDSASAWQVRGDVDASGHTLDVDTLNATAVNTGQLTTEDISTGSGLIYALLLFAETNTGAALSVQHTKVDTSATTIVDGTDKSNGDITGHFVLVTGREPGTGGSEFSDVVHRLHAQGTQNVVSNISGSSAANRSYSKDVRDLQLAMSSGTYDVTTIALEAGARA